MSESPRASAPPLVRFSYHRPGKGTSVFEERLLADRPLLKVLEVAPYRGPPVVVGERAVLEPGSRALWFVIPGAWYDVGRFHHVNGEPTGWYTNFCTPVLLDGTEWRSTDLFLDHWLPAAGSGSWLDETELSEAISSGLLTPSQLRRLHIERAAVGRRLAEGDWPPRAIRNWHEGARPRPPWVSG